MPKPRFTALLIFSFCLQHSFAFQFELTSDNGKIGLLDTANQATILPSEFDQIGWGDPEEIELNGIIRAMKNERWALFNLKGNRITNHDFITLLPFSTNQYIASKRSQSSVLQLYGAINQKGRTLIPFKYFQLKMDANRLIATERGEKSYEVGLFDNKGQTIIPMIYSDVESIGNGYYAVENKEQKLALFDSLGQQITSFQFQEINSVKGNYFEVSYFNRKGIIDQNGKIIVPAIYKRLQFQEMEVRITGYNQWDFIQPNDQKAFYFEEAYSFGDTLFAVATNFKVGVIDQKENHLLYFENYRIDQVSRSFVSIQNLESGFKGVINRKGDLILPSIYDTVIVNDHFVLGKIERSNDKNWFAFNEKGEKLNLMGYSSINKKIGEYLVAVKDNQFGLLSSSGNEITPFEYSSIEGLTNGKFLVESKNGKGVVNSNGMWTITPYCDSIDFRGSHYYFEQGDAKGFIDINGKTLSRVYSEIEYLPFGYAIRLEEGFQVFDLTDIVLFDYSYDTAYTVNNELWYLERAAKKFFYRPSDQGMFELSENIDSLKSFEEGYIGFLKDGQWGFIDEQAQLRISNRYEDVGHFSEGLCAVKLIGKWGVINRAEQIVVQPKYDSISPYYNALSIVESNRKFGLIDQLGGIVLTIKYDFIERHDEWISIRAGNQIGISDIKGRLIKSPQYDEVTFLQNGQFLVKKGQLYGVIDLRGKDIVPVIYQKVKLIKGGYLGLKSPLSKSYRLN